MTLNLQGKLGGATFETLDEVYGRAAHLYRIRGREIESSGGDKRHKPNGNFNGRKDNRGQFGRGNGTQSANHGGNGNRRDGERPQRKYYCKRCEKDHPGKDSNGNPVTSRCYQKLGHREYECYKKEADVKSGRVKESNAPIKPPQPSGPAPKMGTNNHTDNTPKGRVFVMNNRQAEVSNDVVIGTFLIYSLPVKVLFDLGASHSFISRNIVESLKQESPESVSLDVSIPSGEVRNCSKLFRGVPLSISGVEYPSDLIHFDLKDLEVILGMDWLGKYKAQIDCAAQKVTLYSPSKTLSLIHISEPTRPL